MTDTIVREMLPLSFVAAVLLLDKLCLLQAQLHRPIVLCTLLGFMTGYGGWGFISGSLWEFIWANEEPLGANIPPDESAAAAVHYLTAFLLFRDGVYPREITYAVFFVVYPAGYLFSFMDRMFRNLNNRIAGLIEERAPREPRIHLLHLTGPILYFAGYSVLILMLVVFVHGVFTRLAGPGVFSGALLNMLGNAILILSAGVLMLRLKPGLFQGRQR